jgi:hypothetical protein
MWRKLFAPDAVNMGYCPHLAAKTSPSGSAVTPTNGIVALLWGNRGGLSVEPMMPKF